MYATCAEAQTRFTFEPAPTTSPMIEDRPTVTDWIAGVQGTGLIEGRLTLELIINSQVIGTVVTEELVFSGGEQKVRLVLPAYNWYAGAGDEVLVRVRLRTKTGVLVLPDQRLRTTIAYKRKFPLLMGETVQKPRTAVGRDKLADRLRFELMLPEEQKELALTVISHLTANDFPQDALAYCHYEVVAVANDTFAALRAAQLEALAKWVRAGGSPYLEPEGVLETRQLEFLNRLASDDPRKIVFAVDDKGRLPPGVFTDDHGFLLLQPGLGRAVLSLPEETTNPDAQAWKSAHAVLWKARDEMAYRKKNGQPMLSVPKLLRTPNQRGQPEDPVAQEQIRQQLQQQMNQQLQNWQQQQFAGQTMNLQSPPLADVTIGLVDWLRPQGVKMVPLWVIGTLLCSVVVLIGPVDFLVLGRLKRRKWTWITFPAIVIGMTVLTMQVTNAYLSSAEAHKAIVIHDVADDGEIVRTNRFALTFASATRRLTHDVAGALFTPLLTGGTIDPRFGGRMAAPPRRVTVPGPNGQMISTLQMGSALERTHAEPVVMQGRVPTRYQVTQEVRQWTPQLNRQLSIGTEAKAPPLNWQALTIPRIADPEQLGAVSFQELQTQVQSQLGPRAYVAVLSSVGQIVFNGNPQPYRPNYQDPNDPAHWQQQSQWQRMQALGYLQQSSGLPHQPGHSWELNALRELTFAPQQGLAAVCTHTSPHGGRSLDDLPLTALGAAERWWLLVAVPQGDDLIVYRRSFPPDP